MARFRRGRVGINEDGLDLARSKAEIVRTIIGIGAVLLQTAVVLKVYGIV